MTVDVFGFAASQARAKWFTLQSSSAKITPPASNWRRATLYEKK